MLFKAKTWEEVRMITNGNNAMEAAAESLYMANADYSMFRVEGA